MEQPQRLARRGDAPSGRGAGGIVRFGRFELNVQTAELYKEGRPVKLQPQPARVLALLALHAGEVVTREEIRQHVWGEGTFVDFEQGLNYCIKQIRSALGDTAESPEYIETVPKRGYRMIAPVQEVGRAADDRAAQRGPSTAMVAKPVQISGRERLRRWMWSVAALAVVAVLVAGLWSRRRITAEQPVRIAVLPFDMLSGQNEIGFLSLGVPDAIITRLASARRLEARPTASVLRYRNEKATPAQVRETLNVEYVVTGTIQRAAEKFRFNVQLIRTVDGGPVWGGEFDVNETDLLRVEDEVAERVTTALRVELSQAERQRMYRHYTQNAAAYQDYLRGRADLMLYNAEATQRAIANFEKALQADPNYALAYAGIATASAQMYIRFAPEASVSQWRQRAVEAARRALGMDQELAEAHEALAAVARYTEFDWNAVLRESAEALQWNPNLDLPHFYRAGAYLHRGDFANAEAEVRAGNAVNPANRVEAIRLRGTAALWRGDFAAARRYFEELHGISGATIADPYLAQALYYTGDRARAEQILAAVATHSAQAEQRAKALLASFAANRGDAARAHDLLKDVASGNYTDHHVAYSVGAAHAQLHETGAAISSLREAIRSGFQCWSWYEKDPLLEPVRGTPEFRQMVSELKSMGTR